jgi:hypothetical protein
MRVCPRSNRHRGFSLVELLITLLITLAIMIAMLTLFERGSRLSKVEGTVTDSQQNVRYASYQMVREARMTGAGVYPASIAVAGTARQLAVSLSVGSTAWGTGTQYDTSNDIASDIFIGGTHHVRRGTDVLHIRGVITNAVYDLGTASWVPPTGGTTTGTLTIEPCTKYPDPTSVSGDPCFPNGANDMSIFAASGSPQPAENRLFVMSDVLGSVGVGLVTHVDTNDVAAGREAVLTIDVGDSGSPDTAYPQTICPAGIFPLGLINPSRGGILDDRVFFVDDGTASGQDCNPTNAALDPGPCHPQLAVADWAPGDSSATPFSTATVTPIADDIEDLQVAYGMDFYDLTTGSGSWASPAPVRSDPVTGAPLSYPSDGSLSITSQSDFNTFVTAARGSSTPAAGQDPTASTTAGGDEWIWNVAGEPTTGTFDRTSDLSRLRAIEIAILAKGTDPDAKYQGPNAMTWPLLDSTAQTVSQIMKTSPGGTAAPKAFHRRSTTVRVEFRNFNFQ